MRAAVVRVRRAAVVLRCVLAAGLDPALRVERVVDVLRERVVLLRAAGFLVVLVVVVPVVSAMVIDQPLSGGLRILVLSRTEVYPSNMCL